MTSSTWMNGLNLLLFAFIVFVILSLIDCDLVFRLPNPAP